MADTADGGHDFPESAIVLMYEISMHIDKTNIFSLGQFQPSRRRLVDLFREHETGGGELLPNPNGEPTTFYRWSLEHVL